MLYSSMVRPNKRPEKERRTGLARRTVNAMKRLRTAFEVLVVVLLAASSPGCSSGVSLAGDQDAVDGGTDDLPAPADGADDDLPPDVRPDVDHDADTYADSDAVTDGPAEADADAAADAEARDDADGDADADADAGGDADVDVPDAPPDGATAHLVPDDTEAFFDFGFPESWSDSVTPMHRHAFPVAWSGSAYAVVLEDRSASDGAPGPIAVFRFERGVEGLHEQWVDDAAGLTEYNSICWTGEAFIVALPTIDVGLRVLALEASGSVIRAAEVLEPRATYVPAEYGEPPVVLCPETGAFVLDPGRGAGGLDRLYALTPDGAYSGDFVDADVPTFARNAYFAPVPCTSAAGEAACAIDGGLVFLRRDGTVRAADPLPGAPVCGGPAGCDTAFAGAEVAVAGSSATSWPDAELLLSRWGTDGRVLLATTSLGTTGDDGPVSPRIRAGFSGSTVAVVQFGELSTPWPPFLIGLFGLDGSPMDKLPVTECTMAGGCDHSFVDAGAVLWEGDAYVVLWVTGRGVALRRFGVAW